MIELKKHKYCDDCDEFVEAVDKCKTQGKRTFSFRCTNYHKCKRIEEYIRKCISEENKVIDD